MVYITWLGIDMFHTAIHQPELAVHWSQWSCWPQGGPDLPVLSRLPTCTNSHVMQTPPQIAGQTRRQASHPKPPTIGDERVKTQHRQQRRGRGAHPLHGTGQVYYEMYSLFTCHNAGWPPPSRKQPGLPYEKPGRLVKGGGFLTMPHARHEPVPGLSGTNHTIRFRHNPTSAYAKSNNLHPLGLALV